VVVSDCYMERVTCHTPISSMLRENKIVKSNGYILSKQHIKGLNEIKIRKTIDYHEAFNELDKENT